MALSSTAFNTSCQFEPMELHINCVIDMNGTNVDIEASNVSGNVTLNHEQEMAISSCNQTKEVIIYNGECTDMFAKSCIFALNFVISLKNCSFFNILTEFNSIMLYEDVSILLSIVEQSKSLSLSIPQCSP